MTVDIVIPSHHRIEKLIRCLDSIGRNFQKFEELKDQVNVIVYFSDPAEWRNFDYQRPWLMKSMFPDYSVPHFWNTHLWQMDAQILVALSDDVRLFDNVIHRILQAFENYFPDTDGVVGLHQVNIENALESSFVAIGQKYADRFPRRQVFCPDYDRFFADAELGEYAKSIGPIGKFLYGPDIRIIHDHASFDPNLLDETHHDVRSYWPRDHRTSNQRKSLGYLWGKDFNLIHTKE